jgi:uncharacterized membrane protein
MSKQVLKELPDLVKADVITAETAERIRIHYDNQPSQSSNRLFIVFGILGALLVGLGVVLIVAHNWDSLNKVAKLAIGFTPLLMGQCLAAFAILRKAADTAWREGSAAFLFFAIAISISIVSQVYNIEGSLGGFLFIWMSLSLPLVYVLRSSVASLLFILGITWYACEVGYFNYPQDHALGYWMLLLLIVPFYYLEFLRKNQQNNFFYFHSWFLVVSVTTCVGLFMEGNEELIMIAYMSLFSAFIIMSQMKPFETNRVLTNAYLIIGSVGVIILLLVLSFDVYWTELRANLDERFFLAQEFHASLFFTFGASILLFILLQKKSPSALNYKSFSFLIFIALFVIGLNSAVLAQLLVNLLILVLAVYTIRDGAQRNHLGILNYGLLIIAALICCRFFDTDFSFVVRGLLFIAVGVGFFTANYYMIKKRKRQV